MNNKKRNNSDLDSLTNTIRKATVNDEPSEAIIYLRSSSVNQNNEENNHHSLSTQKSLCINYAKQNGYKVISIIEEVKRANDIKKLKINNIPDQYTNVHLLIADPSRMARNIVDGANFMKRCNDSNIIIHSVRDNSVSNTSIGKRKIIDSVMIANDESETVSKRVRTMLQIKKKHGSKLGDKKHKSYKRRILKKMDIYYLLMNLLKIKKNKISLNLLECFVLDVKSIFSINYLEVLLKILQ